MNEPRDLSLTEAIGHIRDGALTAEQLVQSCLDRIAQREPDVRAWATLHGDHALAEARRMDRSAAEGRLGGALHGIPIGIKDIFDVAGMETRAGTEAYSPRAARNDALCVARLRAAGAIVLGKTVTTAFAMGDPGPTRNPWDFAHTPGGSSSGSAAGVADGMCLAALGTQTAGSVIRPASYNGIVGFKPGYGTIPVEGVIPLSWQLDHVGTLTRTVADAHVLWQLMRLEPLADLGHVDTLEPQPATRLWRVREYFEDDADPEMIRALDSCCQRLADAGVNIVERKLPAASEGMAAAHRAIMASEAAAFHRPTFLPDPSRYPPQISELVNEGLGTEATTYIDARRHRETLIGEMQKALGDVDGAIMPAATGVAPKGLAHTGSRVFNVLSSYCGLPVVSLPAALSGDGLPLGVQIHGAAGHEDRLLRTAGWIENLLPFGKRSSG